MKKLLIVTEIIILALIIQSIFITKNYFVGIPLLLVYTAFRLYKSRPSILAFKGNTAFKNNEYEKALILYANACSYSNADNFIKLRYAYIALSCGEVDTCSGVLEIITFNQLPDNLKQSYKVTEGLMMWKSGNIIKAIDILKNIHTNYEHTLVYETLGYLLIINGRYHEALDYNLKAYDYDSTSHIITDNLAQSYYYLNKIEKAKELYNTVLINSEVKPTFPEPYYYYGLILKSEGKIDEAKKYFDLALEQKESFLSTLTHNTIKKELENVA